MIELNLTAKGKEQEIIKEYLQNNVSNTLAEKINNGVKITKDNLTLVNKKDLNDFMKFACEEARKQAEKGSNSACVEDKVVYGWAIHYFEEDSIEGTLYNEDGTEYKKATPKVKSKPITKPVVKKEEKSQTTLFDLLDNCEETTANNNKENEDTPTEQNEDCDDEWTDEEMQEVIEQTTNKEPTAIYENKLVDTETGEIVEPIQESKLSIDKEYARLLFTVLDGKLEVK